MEKGILVKMEDISTTTTIPILIINSCIHVFVHILDNYGVSFGDMMNYDKNQSTSEYQLNSEEGLNNIKIEKGKILKKIVNQYERNI